MGRLARAALGTYKRFVSPHLASRQCRFRPSCSEYAVEAIDKYGLLRGLMYTRARLKRCNPSTPAGNDPP